MFSGMVMAGLLALMSDGVFVETVHVKSGAGALTFEIGGDGPLKSADAVGKVASDRVYIYLSGAKAKATARNWNDGLDVVAHRHAGQVELEAAFPKGVRCRGPVHFAELAAGRLQAVLACSGLAAATQVPPPTAIEAKPVRVVSEPAAAEPKPAEASKPVHFAPIDLDEAAPAPVHEPEKATAAAVPAADPVAAEAAPKATVVPVAPAAPLAPMFSGEVPKSELDPWLLGFLGFIPLTIAVIYKARSGKHRERPIRLPGSDRLIQVLERNRISENRSLLMADVDGRRVLLADTEHGISLLEAPSIASTPAPAPASSQTPAPTSSEPAPTSPASAPTPPVSTLPSSEPTPASTAQSLSELTPTPTPASSSPVLLPAQTPTPSLEATYIVPEPLPGDISPERASLERLVLQRLFGAGPPGPSS